jgi:hypothetical protein
MSQYIYEIWGFHNSEDVDVGLLSCNTMDLYVDTIIFRPDRWDSMFLLNIGIYLLKYMFNS